LSNIKRLYSPDFVRTCALWTKVVTSTLTVLGQLVYPLTTIILGAAK
jgi:hypothetical protein